MTFSAAFLVTQESKNAYSLEFISKSNFKNNFFTEILKKNSAKQLNNLIVNIIFLGKPSNAGLCFRINLRLTCLVDNKQKNNFLTSI